MSRTVVIKKIQSIPQRILCPFAHPRRIHGLSILLFQYKYMKWHCEENCTGLLLLRPMELRAALKTKVAGLRAITFPSEAIRLLLERIYSES